MFALYRVFDVFRQAYNAKPNAPILQPIVFIKADGTVLTKADGTAYTTGATQSVIPT
jgi:hypothetical protein